MTHSGRGDAQGDALLAEWGAAHVNGGLSKAFPEAYASGQLSSRAR
ncbi:hypothetical protein [Streptomyces sp. NPDC059176]